MNAEARLANEAWEALFRAQVVLARRFTDDDIWHELTPNEYDVLYTLKKSPQGMSMTEINRGILLTQAGVSRLCNRLIQRGLVSRGCDPRDRRASVLTLTEAGVELQRAVGARHAAAVTAAMTEALAPDQLVQLRALAQQIVDSADPGPPRHDSQEPS
ncbi:MarR family winged helix-turn-helix transcriptional regulator [Micromonospora profundi]|uniref:MarR family transcriptional regulator n=1 Tax=Micromonospora profundi TaxID=1420889 RepID=A0AAJ6HSK3_9ACTN|nr:MarR family transcriptional regulator [Micromonospora profundi]WLS45387.1 MarR family transcriptional regulator [Micromonospora profundi]